MNIKGKKVIVHDGNVDKALRKFKKKIAEDGLLQELQNRQSYVKPTIKKKLAKNQAKKRWQRYLQSQTLPPKLF
jgi:small subunit ribosomal protein S21